MARSLTIHQFYWYLVSFSLVGILGGGPPNETLEVAIYSAVRFDHIRIAETVCYALWQVLLLFGVRIVLQLVSRRSRRRRITDYYSDFYTEDYTEEWASSKKHLVRSKFVPLLMVLIAIAALVLIVMNPDVFEPVWQGALLSFASAALSIFLAIFFWALRIESSLRVLAWVSPMILSLAWWRTYALSMDLGPNSVWAMAGLVVCVQALLFLPWAQRFLGPVLRRVRIREMDAMRTLGATSFQAWRKLEWPRVAQDTRFLFTVIWSFALSEVSTVILFAKGNFEPLGVWVQNQLMRFRIHEAWVGTILLILLSILMIQSQPHGKRVKGGSLK